MRGHEQLWPLPGRQDQPGRVVQRGVVQVDVRHAAGLLLAHAQPAAGPLPALLAVAADAERRSIVVAVVHVVLQLRLVGGQGSPGQRGPRRSPEVLPGVLLPVCARRSLLLRCCSAAGRCRLGERANAENQMPARRCWRGAAVGRAPAVALLVVLVLLLTLAAARRCVARVPLRPDIGPLRSNAAILA